MNETGGRRAAGLSLFLSALVMLVLSALAWVGVLPFAGQLRVIVGSALIVVAAADALIGWRLIQSGD